MGNSAFNLQSFYFLRPQWNTDDDQLIAITLATLEDYFGSFSKWFYTPNFTKQAIRLCFDYLFDIYLEKFFLAVQKSYHTLGDYKPTRLSINKPNKDKKEKKEKKLKNSTYISVLTNSDVLIKCITRDINTIKSFALDKYKNVIAKNYIERLDTLLGLLLNLIKVPKYDFESLLHSIHENFKELGIYLLNSVLSIREDCDSNFKKEMNRIYNEFIAKK